MPKKALSRAPSAAPAHFFSDLDRIISEPDAARFLGLSRDTLRRQFRAGASPPRVRLGVRRIGYRLSDLHRFVEEHLRRAITIASVRSRTPRAHGVDQSGSERCARALSEAK